jgi:hypothetical protein
MPRSLSSSIGAPGHKVVSILAGRPRSDETTFQALSLKGEEAYEQKCCGEQPNDLILVERDRSPCYPLQIHKK